MSTTASSETHRNQAAARQARFPITRTGAWTRPFNNQAVAMAAAAALAPPAPTRPQVAVVVDPNDSAALARQAAALACRRAGRIVVHTSPGPQPAWRLGIELLCALGKHWDRDGQRCDIAIEVLCRVWLRAEQVTDLIVLRAHQITSKAMAWLLTLLAGEQVRLWLCTPAPLSDLDAAADAAVRLSPAEFTRILQPHPPDCGCEDLNRLPPAPSPSTAPPPLTPTTSRLLRQLHDPELAALGAAALLLGRPDPADQAAARAYVTEDARSVATADERVLQVRVRPRAAARLEPAGAAPARVGAGCGRDLPGASAGGGRAVRRAAAAGPGLPAVAADRLARAPIPALRCWRG
jgi:hypothetical protein